MSACVRFSWYASVHRKGSKIVTWMEYSIVYHLPFWLSMSFFLPGFEYGRLIVLLLLFCCEKPVNHIVVFFAMTVVFIELYCSKYVFFYFCSAEFAMVFGFLEFGILIIFACRVSTLQILYSKNNSCTKMKFVTTRSYIFIKWIKLILFPVDSSGDAVLFVFTLKHTWEKYSYRRSEKAYVLFR